MVKKVGTHNGAFHADEVLACAMLENFYGEIEIIRTRNTEQLATCDIVVDVGGKYDPDTWRFDHHQPNCSESFFDEKVLSLGTNHKFKSQFIPLSSAGMVYKHIGRQLIKQFSNAHSLLGLQQLKNVDNNPVNENSESLLSEIYEQTYSDLYHKMILEVDANDNGIDHMSVKVKPNYQQFLHFGQLVRNLNGSNVSDDIEQMRRFEIAMCLAGVIFEIQLSKLLTDNFTYYKDLHAFIADLKDTSTCCRFKDCKTGSPVLVMNQNYPVWRQYLNDFNHGKIKVPGLVANQFKFTVYPKNLEKTEWGFGTIAEPGQRFVNQIDLLPFDTLTNLLQFPQDLIFVHKNLFCGSATTRYTAIDACSLSYEHQKSPFRLIEHLDTLGFFIVGFVALSIGKYYLT